MKTKSITRFPYSKLLLISVAFGLCMHMNTTNAESIASIKNATIIIDTQNPAGDVNYSDVDTFIATQDQNKNISYAETDVKSKNLILSDKPIEHIYQAKNLSDIRLTLNYGYKALISTTSRIPLTTLADKKLLKMPTIPTVEFTHTQLKPSVNTVTAETKRPLINVTTQTSVMVTPLDLWLGIATLTLIYLLLVARTRKSAAHIKSTYSAIITSSETSMVGNGGMFDFTKISYTGKMSNIDSTYLNMLCQMRKFSVHNESTTYFYAVFYIPPQHKSLSPIQQKVTPRKMVHKEKV